MRAPAPSVGAGVTYDRVLGGYGRAACLLRFRIFSSLSHSLSLSLPLFPEKRHQGVLEGH